MFGVANELVNCRYGIVSNENGKTAGYISGDQKRTGKAANQSEGEYQIPENYAGWKKRMGQIWTEEQIGKK